MKTRVVKLLAYQMIVIMLVTLTVTPRYVQADETVNVIEGYTFEYIYDGQALQYEVISLPDNTENGTVKVIGLKDEYISTGIINIPSTVTLSGATYTVTQIGNNAFKMSMVLKALHCRTP